jgi:hypothetical protein
MAMAAMVMIRAASHHNRKLLPPRGLAFSACRRPSGPEPVVGGSDGGLAVGATLGTTEGAVVGGVVEGGVVDLGAVDGGAVADGGTVEGG